MVQGRARTAVRGLRLRTDSVARADPSRRALLRSVLPAVLAVGTGLNNEPIPPEQRGPRMFEGPLQSLPK
jgi:electron transfer flavoprotein alpha/beta subunit